MACWDHPGTFRNFLPVLVIVLSADIAVEVIAAAVSIAGGCNGRIFRLHMSSRIGDAAQRIQTIGIGEGPPAVAALIISDITVLCAGMGHGLVEGHTVSERRKNIIPDLVIRDRSGPSVVGTVLRKAGILREDLPAFRADPILFVSSRRAGGIDSIHMTQVGSMHRFWLSDSLIGNLVLPSLVGEELSAFGALIMLSVRLAAGGLRVHLHDVVLAVVIRESADRQDGKAEQQTKQERKHPFFHFIPPSFAEWIIFVRLLYHNPPEKTT